MTNRESGKTSRLYQLNDEGLAQRSRARSYVLPGAWLALSAFNVILFILLAADNAQRFAILGVSLVKYIPLLFVIYGLARHKAATYLADIYEIEDIGIADNFIEEVAFGGGSHEIAVSEGKISPEDERSPIILIGGPGKVRVHLDSIVLLERVDGAPEIIEPRNQPWKLGVFERIREIGRFDEPGKREYAIINLRDQFVRNLTVKSRTKDGIPIEARDIKVMFSIQRKPSGSQPPNNPFHYEETAVYSLVYDQAVMTSSSPKPAGVSFPWDTTVIPLVTGELEELIKSHNLSEILASISRKEIETLTEDEQNNTQMRVEMTGEQTVVSAPQMTTLPNFESRSKITAKFFSGEFKEKAAKLGVAIHWIDIGAWQTPNEAIVEELKNAWKLNRDNARRRRDLGRAGARLETQGLMDIINSVVGGYFNKTGGSRKLSDKEYADLMKYIEGNQEIALSPPLQQRSASNAFSKRDAHTIALDILKAFRRELIAGRDLIEKEARSSIEKQAEIAKIDKAVKDIERHLFHFVKGSP